MVEDRVTDGRRIAQLLASELDGRTDGPLDDVAVTDADPDVEPDPEGARAYDVTAGEATLASVFVHPESVHLAVSTNPEGVAEAAVARGLRAVRGPGQSEAAIILEHGAAVKRVVDILTAAVGEAD